MKPITYCLRVAVPRTHKEAVEGLVDPDFPHVVETEAVGPDACRHSISIYDSKRT